MDTKRGYDKLIKLSEHINVLNTSSTKASVPRNKNILHKETIHMPTPAIIKMRMDQHKGVPCVPIVKVGDEVKVGQVIANSELLVSAPIHASVSGTVVKIEELVKDNSEAITEVTIKSDGKQVLDEGLKPPLIKTVPDFIRVVRDSGLVGLGGGAFPTHAKLAVEGKIDMLLINSAECEPYITSDARGILENPYDLLRGIHAVSQCLGVNEVVIGVGDEFAHVIGFLSNVLKKAGAAFSYVSLKVLPSTYPQGAERVLVRSCTNRTVPVGKLPSDVGIVVLNVSTIIFLGQYMRTGVPLILRRVTVDGSAIRQPGNVWVPIGTMIKDIIAVCGGYQEEVYLLLQGGPMMGTAQESDEASITKRTNAVLAFGKSEMKEHMEISCIRCARCIEACPMNLMPVWLDQNIRLKDVEALKALKLNACIGCGLCSFGCPSNRRLVQNFRVVKKILYNSAEGGGAK